MNEVFFTADLHFSHRRIIELAKRNFANVQEHDDSLIASWNSVVTHRSDVVFILGDLAFGPKAKIIQILRRLNGRKVLIRGNHDGSVKGPEIMKFFEFEKQIYSRRFGETKVWMSHFPLETWPGMYEGAILCHGHSHGNLPPAYHRLDVGVDVHGRPITLAEVKERMIKDPVFDRASLYRQQRDELREKLRNIGDVLMGR